MKILFLHPYGSTLTDWNHRLKRQIDLMKEKCELMVIGKHISPDRGLDSIWMKEVSDAIKNFKPDVLYVNGYFIAHYCIDIFDKIVFDMGSYRTRNELLENHKLNYADIRKIKSKELKEKANYAYSAIAFQREDRVIRSDKVKAIIIWEGEEANLVRKIHDQDEKIKELSMIFYDLPKPIPWEEKEERVLAISAKWGEDGKNGRLLANVNLNIRNDKNLDKKYLVQSVGHSGDNNIAPFISHNELMDLINKSKVVFCPYFCGGIGVVNEALKLGCNVIVCSWYPYQVYINDELIVDSSEKVTGRVVYTIQKAMEKYYPPKKPIPTEEEQINKILNVCQEIVNK